VAAVPALAGSRLGGLLAGPRDGALYRLVVSCLAGWVGLHLLLTVLDLAGIPWSLPAIAAATAIFFLLARRARPAPGDRAPRPPGLGPGWGDGVALAALLVFTLCALSLWIATPDFIYHWGLKGHRFYLSRGVDYGYLSRRWNWVVHPDYPNLLPELFAATALAAGRFDEPAMMLWSAFTFALLLAAVREALRRAATSRFTAQAALAGLALLLAAYGIGGLSAGGADWLIALALAAAMPPLLSPADRRGAAQIGVIAAFAAASKMEGVTLAVILMAIYAARLWSARAAQEPARGPHGAQEPQPGPQEALEPQPGPQETPEPAPEPHGAPEPPPGHEETPAPAPARPRRPWRAIDPRGIAALVLPAAAVVLPWLAEVRRHHLFVQYNAGPLAPERIPLVLATTAATLHAPPWHGFAYALVLLPLLALDRRLRAIAAVVCVQLAFYLYVYLSVRLEPKMLILASFPRLVLHLLPAVLTGAAIALERPTARAGVPRVVDHSG
jgi:hypothetical protein